MHCYLGSENEDFMLLRMKVSDTYRFRTDLNQRGLICYGDAYTINVAVECAVFALVFWFGFLQIDCCRNRLPCFNRDHVIVINRVSRRFLMLEVAKLSASHQATVSRTIGMKMTALIESSDYLGYPILCLVMLFPCA